MVVVARISFVIFVLASVVGCGQKSSSKNDSQVKFGNMVGMGWDTMTALAVAPDTTLSVCDDSGLGAASGLQKAVREWAASVGMDKHMKIGNCGEGSKSIHLLYGGCSNSWAIAETSFNSMDGWNMRLCNGTQSNEMMLHETGHIFGQCDRYTVSSPSFIAKGFGCGDYSNTTDGNYTAPSAMQALGPYHPNRVTEDDRAGLLALIKRDEVIGATSWRAVLGTNPQPSSGSTNDQPPPSSNSTINPAAAANSTNHYILNGQTYSCPQNMILYTDGYCHANASAQSNEFILNGTRYSCPAGTVLYTDGYCR